MQYVKFNLDEFQYVMPLSEVVEIVPYIKIKNSLNALEYQAGFCEYRGNTIPVVDLCSLFIKRPCRKKLSTRIILVETDERVHADNFIGLIAEKATEILNTEEESFIDAGMYMDDFPHNGPVLADASGMISLIHPDEIFSLIDPEKFSRAGIKTT